MPTKKDISPNIKWPLSEGVPAFSREKIFSAEMLEDIKQTISTQAMWGPEHGDNLNNRYHTITGRWVAEPNFSTEVWEHLTTTARRGWGRDDLKLKILWVARYQKFNGVTPYLWEHMDQPPTQYTMDICIESPGVQWAVEVDGRVFEESENSAIFMMGQQEAHSRPPYPTEDENAYVVVMFGLFADSTHWMYDIDAYNDADTPRWEELSSKYKLDGDVRYYEYSGHAPRFDNLPEGNYPCDGGKCTQCHVVPENFIDDIDGYIHLEQ